ncbi:lytic transglycosylase domain-containing protein [Caulobacter sp. SL161]|uniref:lytic transglycosylase domain-containing protein n=1 Tax=Caulobacter sp. SL161 TaxID=2995156 RepID=UPI0022738313|nr:lytic transglycosylase domain-containing protein [Caulobacter sp. SL161]MCY1647474.1 lytic transglycosylase domain-containing protein [Caulobacter sp. SL161]
MRPTAVIIAAIALWLPALAHAQVFEVGDDGVTRRTSSAVQPGGQQSPTPKAARSPFAPVIDAAAARYALAPELVDAIARQESAYNQAAVSPKGAIGVMQLMPGTARTLGVDPRDAVANINGGAAYLRQMIDKFDGRIDLALAAYNAGPGAVARHDGVPPYRETQTYVATALNRLASTSLAQTNPQSGDQP